jgi:branched-chain amino acid transport system substrate-binding protein
VLPAARGWKERGYAGQCTTRPTASANNDFLRVGGKDVEARLLPSGPVLVAAQLPNEQPGRKSALEVRREVRSLTAERARLSTFGAHAWVRRAC